MNIKVSKYKVKVTLTTPMLGTVPTDKDVFQDYVQAKAPALPSGTAEAEIETLPVVSENDTVRAKTGFHTIDGKLYLHERHPIGFFKAACLQLRRIGSTEAKKRSAYTKILDGAVMVTPRWIPIQVSNGPLDAFAQADIELGEVRPLRASTPQGPRVAIANSDVVPQGSTFEFQVRVLGNLISEELLREMLDYGEWCGFGQWRGSGGMGRFTYEMNKV